MSLGRGDSSGPRRVAVLGGGRSSEHEVSLASAASVANGLRSGGHEVVPVEIGRDGVWRVAVPDFPAAPAAPDFPAAPVAPDFPAAPAAPAAPASELALTPGRGLLGVDVVFPVLHGPFGEDGTVQGLLELLDVPYVGAGVLASAVCMDKVVFKELMARAGVPQVAHRAVTARDWSADSSDVLRSLGDLGLPVFVKPARLGSSVGIDRVLAGEQLRPALEAAFSHDPLVIVEAAATGIEVECAVLGNEDPIASVPGEILLASGEAGWYDYEAKYTPGGMELVVPARVPPEVRERVQTLAVEAFQRAGCAGLARADFFVDGETVLVNELNTMPGFTETSVYVALWAASGTPYPELLDRLVGLAIERYERERAYTF
ncbi:MAG: D-alanine--D-alanine ligase [Conexibacteraceae bacterium]|nr:D-alanine--D-alanine ligase [Conexibacteraceae bacterium]